MQSYYDLLRTRPEATQAEIRHAYRQAVKRTHPDLGGTSAEFAEVQAAWRVLGDPGRRATYDRQQTPPPTSQPHASQPSAPSGARPAPAAPRHRPSAHDPRSSAAPADGQPARPLVRPIRLAVLGPIALSGALTTAILGAVATPLIVVGAGYVLLTLLAVARRAHPEIRRRVTWPGSGPTSCCCAEHGCSPSASPCSQR